MELLLSVTYPSRGASRRSDLAAELDAFSSVGVLRDALVAFLAEHGEQHVPSDAVIVLVREDRRVTLGADTSVFDTGLVSGDEIHLVDPGTAARMATATAPLPDRDAPAVTLDVTSGPDTGRSVRLGPGRHLVGRAPDCALVIDDPMMSAHHLALAVGADLAVRVEPNPNATNGTLLDGAAVSVPAPVSPEQTIFAGSTGLTVRPARSDVVGSRDRLGQIGFNRLPYRRPVVRERAFDELDPPPEAPGPRRFSMAAVLVPLIGAGAIVLVTKRWEFALLAGLSPLMMIANYVSEGKHSRRSYERARAAFLASVDERAGKLTNAMTAERAERFAAAPDVPTLARQADARLGRLWERHRGSPDFLDLRVGLGERDTLVRTAIRAGGDGEVRREADRRLAFHRSAQLVPVTVALDEHGVTGIYGEPDDVAALGAALVVQAACLHSPEDLVIVAALPDHDAHRWSWLKWLPHVRAVTSPVAGAHLVPATSTDDLIVRLLAVAEHRLSEQRRDRRAWPRVLALVPEENEPDRSLLATLLDVALDAGIDVLWLGEDQHELPRQCRAVVHAVPETVGPSALWFTDPERTGATFEPAGVAVDVATRIARSLAPVRDISGRGAATAIPRLVGLLDALGMPAPSGADVAARWATGRPYGLTATIGMSADGPLSLDLVQQGPHTLVAGTSGSGKSELLQSLVLALATTYPPTRLTFLFIDYKGGASSAELTQLPHTVGQVTNLDERLSRRALVSLRAELDRRMSLLEGRAKDLAEMIRIAPDEAPPSLVIICDEFATLVKEIPDFVSGIVDIAQRGRSLGIHLVLATQRPAGAVNDNILANTNLRIALRVLDPAESTSIIGATDAADIPVPLRGRAFARTGPGPLVAFQCAWSGAPHVEAVQQAAVTLRPFGTGTTGAAAPAVTAAEGAPTQLRVTVRACREAAERQQLPPPARPWVEPLPEHLALETVFPRVVDDLVSDPGRRVVIGLADDPSSQSQVPVVVDLEATGGLAVYGTGGCGKTTLLRTAAASLACQGGADAVVLYGMDFAGRALDPLAELPQTAAVIANDEIERATRLITVLRREVERRHDLLAGARAENLSALRRHRGSLVVPRIVVLLDGYAGFHSTFDQGALFTWITELQRLVTEGRQVGIHLVMTTNRQLGVPSALVSAMSARIVLRMSTPDELMGLGVPREVAHGAELPDGRGFLDGRTDIQVATVGDDPSGAAQAATLGFQGAHYRRHGFAAARPLPELPSVVPLRARRPGGSPLRPFLGVADLTLEPVTVDLSRQNLVVVGPPLSGRSAAVAAVAVGVAGAADGTAARPRLVGIGGAVSPLAKLDVWDAAGFGRAAARTALGDAVAQLAGYEGSDVRLVLVIDAAEDVESMENGAKLESLARTDAVRIVTVLDPSTLSRAFSGWTAELKSNRSLLHLQPASPAEVEAFTGAKPTLRPSQAFPPGRGVLVDRRAGRLVQVALPDGFEGSAG